MSETAPEMTELERKRAGNIAQQQAQEAEFSEMLDEALPTPAGYMILIALPDIEETFGESSIAKADSTKREEHILSTLGMVLELGAQAYTDKERFPGEPWCKEGDFVMFRPNTGTRFKIAGKEFRLLSDDSVQAVVPKPQLISRA